MADCVYYEPAFPLLIQTLVRITRPEPPHTLVYLAYKKRRKADKQFFSLLRKDFILERIEYSFKDGQQQGVQLFKVIRKELKV